MGEFKNILKQSKFENLVDYLINEIGDTEEDIDSYDKIISQSYETFFSEIENLYTQANREDDRLFDIVTKMTCTHDDIYFKAGALVGFQLYKEFENKYKNHKDIDIAGILKN